MYQRTSKLKSASRVPSVQKPILDIDKSFYFLPSRVQDWILGNTLNIFKLLRSLNEIIYSPNVNAPFLKNYEKTLFVPLRLKQNVKVYAYRRGNYIRLKAITPKNQ
jgi:hypothetical protein